eukprot:SM000059S18654  [mRNA]  locus=s59:166511:171209:- [translate_table: standard]
MRLLPFSPSPALAEPELAEPAMAAPPGQRELTRHNGEHACAGPGLSCRFAASSAPLWQSSNVLYHTELQTRGRSSGDHHSRQLDLKRDRVPRKNAKKTSTGKNALAGGLAGTIVSCCIHPVDTLKTMIQASHGSGRSPFHTLATLVHERGFGGLYRGLGSNMTTSAPISALYTCTYEAVKEALLPRLSNEHWAVAHCVAGGCASVATSFVFTPSEAVKQRMQLGGHYNNSWTALVSILRNEGIASLYSGWGAVLARNVPQSIIKFLTYEGLKGWVLKDRPQDQRLSTFQTLAIGGAAGSTAAFVTTPFDVIKTRLQAQVPGTLLQYNGVRHALSRIVAEEGVAGLYRGVLPRLFIYVSQGAIFFASYEALRHLLALNAQELCGKTVGALQAKPLSRSLGQHESLRDAEGDNATAEYLLALVGRLSGALLYVLEVEARGRHLVRVVAHHFHLETCQQVTQVQRSQGIRLTSCNVVGPPQAGLAATVHGRAAPQRDEGADPRG